MGNFNYNGLIPAANDPPKNDQPQMQTNAASISSIIAIDHIGFNTPNGGYHTDIHMVSQTPLSAKVGQLQTLDIGSDNQLFYTSNAGIITQLTGPNTPLAASNGYTWLPGGILLQWGIVTSISSTGTVTYITDGNINFPTNSFSVVATLGPTSPPTSNAQTISVYNTSTSSFSYNYSGGSAYNRFRWIAIGN